MCFSFTIAFMKNIDFDTEEFNKYKPMNTDNVSVNDPLEARKHEALADELIELFPPTDGSDLDTTRLFFLKATYRLPEPFLRRLAVKAKDNGRGNGGALFNWLVRKESGFDWDKKQSDDN